MADQTTPSDEQVLALRERIAAAIPHRSSISQAAWEDCDHHQRERRRALALSLLAILHLDDLDAAVERGARADHDEYDVTPWEDLIYPVQTQRLADARRILEAALTATPER